MTDIKSRIAHLARDGEEEIILSHLIDLGKRSWERGRLEVSAFLSESLCDGADALLRETMDGEYLLWGGYEGSKRKCAVFLPEYYSAEDVTFRPDLCEIAFVKVLPDKFHKGDELSHRDVLGALMNLGIKRECVGDIVFDDGIIIVTKTATAGFIVENLTRIKHSTVTAALSDTPPVAVIEEKVRETTTVPSMRADAVLSSVFNTSRALSAEAIEKGLVQLNSTILTKPTVTIREGDIISWRTKGRRKILSIVGESKKGRTIISYEK